MFDQSVRRQIWLASFSVNQMFPSGPTVRKKLTAWAVGTANSVRSPCGVRRPILLAFTSQNQMFPSGPVTIWVGVDLSDAAWKEAFLHPSDAH